MEEPDPEETPIVFTATERNEPEAAGNKKEIKRSVGERSRARKSTPRPIMKGEGRKRFGDSLSPNRQPESKRSIVSNCNDDGSEEESLKHNLLSKLEEEAEISGMKPNLTAGVGKVDGRKIDIGSGQTEMLNLNGNNGEQRVEPSNCPPPAKNPSTVEPIPTVAGEVSAPNTNKCISQMEQGTILADSKSKIFEENFPHLSQGSTKHLAAKFEGMKQGPSVWNRKPSSAGIHEKSADLGGESNKKGNSLEADCIILENNGPNVLQRLENPSRASKVKEGVAKIKPNEPFVL